MTFGLEEIERIGPGPGEDVALAAEAARLQSADDFRESAQSAVHALAGPEDEAGGALAMLYTARKALSRQSLEMLRRPSWVIGWLRRAISSPI